VGEELVKGTIYTEMKRIKVIDADNFEEISLSLWSNE
jgi:hypothetical protein